MNRPRIVSQTLAAALVAVACCCVRVAAGETVTVENEVSRQFPVGVGTFKEQIQAAWKELLLRTTLVGDDVKTGPIDELKDKGTCITWSSVYARAPYTMWVLSEKTEHYKFKGAEKKYDDIKHRMRTYLATVDEKAVDGRAHAKIAGGLSGGGGNGGAGGGGVARTPDWYSLAVDIDLDVDSNRNGTIAPVNQNDGDEAKAEEKAELSHDNPLGAISPLNRRVPLIVRKLMEKVEDGDVKTASLLEGYLLILHANDSAGRVRLFLPGTDIPALIDHEEKGVKVPEVKLAANLFAKVLDGKDIVLDMVGQKLGKVDLFALLCVKPKRSESKFTEFRDVVRVTVSEEWERLPLGGKLQMSHPAHFRVYVPTKFGGRLFVKSSAGTIEELRSPNGKPYTSGEEISGQGNPVFGEFTFAVAGAESYDVSCSFIQTGEALNRPWNGWYCPTAPTQASKLYDENGEFTPLKDYDASRKNGTPRAFYVNDNAKIAGVTVMEPVGQPLKVGVSTLEWNAAQKKLRWNGGAWSRRIERSVTGLLQGSTLSGLVVAINHKILPGHDVNVEVKTIVNGSTREWESRYHVGRQGWEGHCWGWSLVCISKPIRYKVEKGPDGQVLRDEFGFMVYCLESPRPGEPMDLVPENPSEPMNAGFGDFSKWEIRSLYTELGDSCRVSRDKPTLEALVSGIPSGPVTEADTDPIDRLTQEYHDCLRNQLRLYKSSVQANLRGSEVYTVPANPKMPGVTIQKVDANEDQTCRIYYHEVTLDEGAYLRLDWHNLRTSLWQPGDKVPVKDGLLTLRNAAVGSISVAVSVAQLPRNDTAVTFLTDCSVWNHAIFRYKAAFRQAPGSSDTKYVEIHTVVTCNSDTPFPPTEHSTTERTYTYRLRYDARGETVAKDQNWVGCSQLPPSGLNSVYEEDLFGWFARSGVLKAEVDKLRKAP